MDISPAMEGNQVKVLVEEMDGGNYTCHLGPGGQYLNHTLILVQLNPDNRPIILEEISPEEGKIGEKSGGMERTKNVHNTCKNKQGR